MRDIFLAVFVFGSLPLIISRPWFGLLVWAWLGYMNPHRLTYGFAFDFPFVQVVALATLVGLFMSVRKSTLPTSGLFYIWLAFVIWMSLTTVVALNPEAATAGWIKTLKTQVMMFVTLLVIDDKRKLNYLVWIVVGSIAFYGIKGGLFTFATGGQYRVWGPIGSYIEGNNEIALALVVVIPLLRYLYLLANRKILKVALALSAILCMASVLGSYSRGAFLAGAAILFSIWIRTRNKLVTGIVLGVAGIIALNAMPQEWTTRMQTINTYEEDASVTGRFNAWQFAFRLASDRPIVGGGFNTFTPELFQKYAPNPEDFHDAHSIFFEVMAEQGFVGLILFLLIGLFTLREITKIRNLSDGHAELEWAIQLAYMLQAAFIGYAVGGAFLGLAYFDLPYHLMTMVLILGRIVVTESKQHQIVSEKEHFRSVKSGDAVRRTLKIEFTHGYPSV